MDFLDFVRAKNANWKIHSFLFQFAIVKKENGLHGWT